MDGDGKTIDSIYMYVPCIIALTYIETGKYHKIS